MNSSLKNFAFAVALFGAVSATSGCSSIAALETSARADRAANPEKYQEDPAIQRQQMTPNQEGAAYPQFCTWGCQEQIDLTRNW